MVGKIRSLPTQCYTLVSGVLVSRICDYILHGRGSLHKKPKIWYHGFYTNTSPISWDRVSHNPGWRELLIFLSPSPRHCCYTCALPHPVSCGLGDDPKAYCMRRQAFHQLSYLSSPSWVHLKRCAPPLPGSPGNLLQTSNSGFFFFFFFPIFHRLLFLQNHLQLAL